MESGSWGGRRKHANLVLTADKVRTDDVEFGLDGAKLLICSHNLGPDLTLERSQSFAGRAFQQHLAGCNDGHARAKFAHIVDDVGGQNNDDVAADGGKKIQKAIALGGVKPSRGLIDNNQARVGQQRLCDAKRCFIPPE